MSIRPLLAVLPLLAACGKVSGVWMITVPYQEGGQTCESTFNENFVDGYVPGDDTTTNESDWTTTETYEGADTLFFAQVETTGDGGAVLLLGSAAYPGAKEKGTWVFEWNDEFMNVVENTHTSGYTYTYSETQVNTGTLTLTPDGLFGGSATGTFTASSETTDSYVESDTWNDKVVDSIGETGQIPSSAWLVFDDQNDNQRPQNNDFDVEDCDGNCSIVMSDVCSGSNDFTAVHTNYKDEDAFAYLMTSGNGS